MTVADAAAWVELHADPAVNRFVGSYTVEAATDRLRDIERQWAERGHGLFAVEDRADGRYLGRAGLYYWSQFDETEVGWTLRADAWGRGYATEAARSILAWGFATLELPYLTAMIHRDNAASLRVAQRLGFVPGRDETLYERPVQVHVLERPESD